MQPISEASQLYNPLEFPCFTLRFSRKIITIDVLSSLPRDVGYIRQLLFDLPLPFLLNTANYKLF